MKITPYIVFAFLYAFIPVNLFAQEYSLSGNIVDENNEPIAYANVILRTTNDLTLVSGTSSNDEGYFAFEGLNKNDYSITISFIGYEDALREVMLNQDTTLEVITLNESAESIGEVVLTFNKPTLKKEVDRLVFNVEKTALSEGNMMEVVRNTPGVLVLDNNITIKNASPAVYINDRKVHLSGEELAQLLEGSSANTIKSVEVITNPPAKYDAESGAVLNIVMSKNVITGYNGSVFTNYTQGVYPRYNIGTTNFYKTDKISVFANYNYNHKKINRFSIEKINFINSDVISENWQSRTDRNTWSETHNLNVNFDYFLNERNTLSFSSSLLYLPYFKHATNGNTDISDFENDELSNFTVNNVSKDKKHNLGFDLDYMHNFLNKAKLSLNVHYTDYNYDRSQNVLSNYYPANSNMFTTAFNTTANQGTNIVTAQADYVIPVKDNVSFSAGVKTSFIKTNSDINQFDNIANVLVFNPANSNAFNYKENISAAYVSYREEHDTFTFSGGLRVEQTNTEGISLTTNEKSTANYFEWFPTLNLSHQVSDDISFNASYNRRVDRPNYQALNPFKYFLNDNTIVTGNPNLKPTFINHFVLGSTIKDIFTAEVYYKTIKNNFIELPIQDNQSNLLVYTPTNLNRGTDFGLDLWVFFNVTERWFVYALTSIYNVEEEAMFNREIIKKNTWSNYSVLSSDLSFLKDKSLTANFTVTYAHKNQQGLIDVDSRIISDLSIKKTLFKKKGTLSLIAADLFNEQNFFARTKYLNQNNSRFYNLDSRYLKLGFSYKFGNTRLKTNERTKELKERDRLEKE